MPGGEIGFPLENADGVEVVKLREDGCGIWITGPGTSHRSVQDQIMGRMRKPINGRMNKLAIDVPSQSIRLPFQHIDVEAQPRSVQYRRAR